MAEKICNIAPVSPLRYPGAKRWMSRYICRSITYNDIRPECFVELFAGGASVSLAQLHYNLVDCVALIDRDPLVASFWQTVFFDTDWLVDEIWKTIVTVEKWKHLRNQRPTTIRERAFKCLYLNRTSFSGILAKSAGPIGGNSQESKYKIDCRFNKETLIKRIQTISKYSNRVLFVWNLHWRNAVSRIKYLQLIGSLPQSMLFYLDPPFYKKANKLYTYFFRKEDHMALRDFLGDFDKPWILSYDSCPEVISMYKDLKCCASNVNLIYTTSQKGKRGIGKELIVSNLPKMVSELHLGVGKRAAAPFLLSELSHKEILSSNEKNEPRVCWKGL